MTDYTKTTDFAAKDSLPSGDSGKIIKGTEFETEFDNIATAVATKSNIASPTFTGTTTIPTVDINGGAIDGTTVGAASASTGAFTTLTASTSLNIASSTTVDGVLDEDNMASDSASKLATQQSIKAYVDSQIGANNELSEVLSNGNTTGGTDISVSSGDDITFADNSKVIFGDDSDLQIYHDGLNSYIAEGGTGNLQIQAQNLSLEDSTGTRFFLGIQGGETRLYNQGNQKVAVTSTGVDVTGTVTFGDGHTIGDDSFDNLVIASSTAENIILNANDAGVTVKGDTQFLVETEFGTDRFKVDTSTGDISFYDGSGNAGLFWDASAESLGIGTTSPDRPLHIAGNPAMLLLEDTGGAADDKRAQLQVDSGVFEINSRNDDNSSRVDNIFIADLGTGNIGIGTVSPSAKLDTAYTDTATYSATSPSADLILSRKNTGNTANETVGIRFDITGWSGSTTGGAAIEAIQPSNASTADLAFLTRDAGTWGERLRITSNGSVGIGTDSPTRKLHVNDESNSIVGRFSSGQTSTWAQFASNSTGTASRIGSPTDDAVASIAVITRDQERLRIDADGHVIIPEGVTLGTAAGTYNADNTLDDYEEGTWTPTVFGQTTAGTYTLTDGGSTYTKVGRKVTVIAKIRDITEVSAGVGNLNIGGLPFAVSVVGQGALRFNTLDVANDSINFSVENYVTSTVYISESKDNASGSVTGLSAITSGTTDIFFTLTYFA